MSGQPPSEHKAVVVNTVVTAEHKDVHPPGEHKAVVVTVVAGAGHKDVHPPGEHKAVVVNTVTTSENKDVVPPGEHKAVVVTVVAVAGHKDVHPPGEHKAVVVNTVITAEHKDVHPPGEHKAVVVNTVTTSQNKDVHPPGEHKAVVVTVVASSETSDVHPVVVTTAVTSDNKDVQPVVVNTASTSQYKDVHPPPADVGSASSHHPHPAPVVVTTATTGEHRDVHPPPASSKPRPPLPLPYTQAFRDSLRTGDIFSFIGPEDDPLDKLITKLEEGDFSHCGMVIRNGDGDNNLWFWDAPGYGYMFTDPLTGDKHQGARVALMSDVLPYYMSYYPHQVFTYRKLSPELSPAQTRQLIDYVRTRDGAPFPGLGVPISPTLEANLKDLVPALKQAKYFGLSMGLFLGYMTGVILEEALEKTLFCSNLIAETYIHVGVLPAPSAPGGKVANAFSPSGFNDQPTPTVLAPPFSLGPNTVVQGPAPPAPPVAAMAIVDRTQHSLFKTKI
eukprot:TRINITY_DN350_c0_g1_i3.p1 TRINITY_DN350_c0_g1~~TRINITY_DN350_c0_g1_i3.p1  ORF type:complete len:502 (-),score=132.21 TRINITY_DN350_c0_g1_i3:50-1555(-)